MKSGTKTSRDLKRDRIHDWKAPANQLDSTYTAHTSAKQYKSPDDRCDYNAFQRDNEPRAPSSKKPAHRTRRDCHNILDLR